MTAADEKSMHQLRLAQQRAELGADKHAARCEAGELERIAPEFNATRRRDGAGELELREFRQQCSSARPMRPVAPMSTVRITRRLPR